MLLGKFNLQVSDASQEERTDLKDKDGKTRSIMSMYVSDVHAQNCKVAAKD